MILCEHILWWSNVDDVASRIFQQYFSYIVAVSLLLKETVGPRENHRPVEVTDKLDYII